MMRFTFMVLAVLTIVLITLTTDVSDYPFIWYPICFLVGFGASYLGGVLDDKRAGR